MSSILVQVGSRIRFFRKEKGITQEELAEISGLHHSYIGGVERGDRNVSLESLEKIIFALEVSAGDLFQIQESELNYNYDKATILNAHKTLLMNMDIAEIKLIHKIALDIVKTYHNDNN